MFCKTCGCSRNESANFCENCGSAFQICDTKRVSDSSLNSGTASPSCSNGKQPLSFQEYMEKRLQPKSQDATFSSIKKRKSNERMSEDTKKKNKKHEVIKVL